MGFIIGLLGGLVAGAAGAVLYSMQTGRDLRDEFQQVRSEIQARDFEGLANHLEDRLKEVQASIEKLRSETDQGARDVADDLRSAAGDAAKDVKSATNEA